MTENTATTILQWGAIYFGLGVLFTVISVVYGIKKIDRQVKGSSFGFYLITMPATIFLWPVVLSWIIKRKPNYD